MSTVPAAVIAAATRALRGIRLAFDEPTTLATTKLINEYVEKDLALAEAVGRNAASSRTSQFDADVAMATFRAHLARSPSR